MPQSLSSLRLSYRPPPESLLTQRLKQQGAVWTEEENWVYRKGETLDLSGLGLTELPNISYIDGNFDCSYNVLSSLKGCPEKVEGLFDCSHNVLTDLVNGPQSVEGAYFCQCNRLSTLKGAPKITKYNFYCSDNDLTSLFYVPASHFGHNSFIVVYNNYLSWKELYAYRERLIFKETQKDIKTLNGSNNTIKSSDKNQEEPLDIQEEPKAQENPYGSLHPSEIKWDSIGSTESRGFPLWAGVPKKTLYPIVPKEKKLKGLIEACKTHGDLLGIQEVQENQEGSIVQLVLKKDLSASEKKELDQLLLNLKGSPIVANIVKIKP